MSLHIGDLEKWGDDSEGGKEGGRKGGREGGREGGKEGVEGGRGGDLTLPVGVQP